MIDSIVIKQSYQGDGSTTQFPFSFPFLKATDIKVTIHDNTTGAETTLTSDYYVDTNNSKVLYPGYPPGEAPALSEQPGPLPVGQKLIIYRSTPISQLEDLGDKYPLPIIEDMVDKCTLILQELSEKLDRAVLVEIGSDTTPDQLLQSIADSVVKAKAWAEGTDAEVTELGGTHSSKGWSDISKGYAEDAEDSKDDAATWAEGNDTDVSALGGTHSSKGWSQESAGHESNAQKWAEGTDAQVVALGGTHSAKVWAQTAAKVYYVDTMAAMRADSSLTPGMIVMTKGYYAANDGGAGTYNIRAAEAGDTDDGGSIVVLDNGNVAELITDGAVNVRQFGAKGDGVTDDTNVILNSVKFVYAKYNGGIVFFPAGTYCVTTLNLRQYRNITLAGAGVNATKLLASGTSGNYVLDVKYFGQYGQINIHDFCIGGAAGTYTEGGISVRLVGNSSIKNVKFEYLNQCIRGAGTESIIFENIEFTEFNYGIRGALPSEYTEMEIDSSLVFADNTFVGLNFNDGNTASSNSIAITNNALNSNKFIGCIFFGEHLAGIRLNEDSGYGGNTFVGCRFERMQAGVPWMELGSYNYFYDCAVYTDGGKWSYPAYAIDIFGVGNFIDGVSPEYPKRVIRLRNSSARNNVTWRPGHSSNWLGVGAFVTPVIDFGTNNKINIGDVDHLVNRVDSYSDLLVTNLLPRTLDQACFTLDGVTKTDTSAISPAGRGPLNIGQTYGYNTPTGNRRFYATLTTDSGYYYCFSAWVAVVDTSTFNTFNLIAGHTLTEVYPVEIDKVNNLWSRVSIIFKSTGGTTYFGIELPATVDANGLLVAFPQVTEMSGAQNIVIGGYVPTNAAYVQEFAPHFAQRMKLLSAPNAGRHYIGDVVENLDKKELGSAGSKYVLDGWVRLTNSADNALGTDWVEKRVLTGN